MKHIKTLIFVAISSFLLATNCEKELNELPPETTTGRHTFGCLVNGEIFLDSKSIIHWGRPNLWAEYSKNYNSLSISAMGKKNGKIASVEFTITNPVEMLPVKIDAAIYNAGCYVNNPDCPCPYFIGKNTGNVILTRFDTINEIVSGRFYFDGICSDNNANPISDSVGYVTEGRFDIKWMHIYE